MSVVRAVVAIALVLLPLLQGGCGRRRRHGGDDDDDDATADAGADGDGDVDGDGDADGDCPAAPADVSASQREALRIVNELRTQIGVPCATMVPEINDAAQAHADYGRLNFGLDGCASTGHDETEGCEGFSGVSFWERMVAAGYAGGASAEVAHFMGDPAMAIDGWVGTLWHRVPVVAPNTDELGYGTTTGWDVMDFGTQQPADSSGVWFYPYDGATVSPNGGDEVPPPPDPPSGCGGGFCQWGTFVTVLFESSAAVTVDVHELEGPWGPVEHGWEGPGGFLGNGYAMVTDPLDSGADYTVRVAGRIDAAPFDRSISFHTQ